MNELLPIIRRKRRPLLPVEVAPPVATIKSEPEQTVATVPNSTNPTPGTQDKEEGADAHFTKDRESR